MSYIKLNIPFHLIEEASIPILPRLTGRLLEEARALSERPLLRPGFPPDRSRPLDAALPLDEFARLDLSRMDFSEVYAEFTDAARLPDELETSILIQQKIDDYYARGGQ